MLDFLKNAALKTFLSFLLVLSSLMPGFSQRKLPSARYVQLSVVPGLSTNGIHPGTYANYFSLNIFTGYSSENYLLEVGGLSNLNQNGTRGLQVAGLANFTGANAYAGLNEKERDKKMRDGFSAPLTGLQISGMTNFVLHDVYGGQATGGVNSTRGALTGVQLAGLSNLCYKYTFGVQVSGLSNISYQSMDGIQLAGLSNYTKGELFGLQVAAFNRTGRSEGVNSFQNNDPTGVQVGIFNWAGKMNGFQLGLINFAKVSQGTQIGLINIYRRGKTAQTRDGTSIGLLNVGDFGYLATYANELFLYNIELATGNEKNSRVEMDRFAKYVHNALIWSTGSIRQSGQWALGYGLKKMFFNRSAVQKMTAFRFFSYGLDILHINEKPNQVSRDLNLLTRLKVMAGTKLTIKLKVDLYVIGFISANGYTGTSVIDPASPLVVGEEAQATDRFLYWPGAGVGIMVR